MEQRIDELVGVGNQASASLEKWAGGLTALKNSADAIKVLDSSIPAVVKSLDVEAKSFQKSQLKVKGLVNDLRSMKKELAGMGDDGDDADNARFVKKVEALFAKMDAAKNETDQLANTAVAAAASEAIINVVGNLDTNVVANKIKNIPNVIDICKESIDKLNQTANENIAEPAKDSINDITKLLNQIAGKSINKPGGGADFKLVEQRIDEFVNIGNDGVKSLEQWADGLTALKNSADAIKVLDRSIPAVVKNIDTETKSFQKSGQKMKGLLKELDSLKNEVANNSQKATAAVNARITKKANVLFAKMETAKDEINRLANSAVAAQASEKIINAVDNLDATTVAKKIKNIPNVIDICKRSIDKLSDAANANIVEPAKDSINDITKLLTEAAGKSINMAGGDAGLKAAEKKIDDFVGVGKQAVTSLKEWGGGLTALKNSADSIKGLDRSLPTVVKNLDTETKAFQKSQQKIDGLLKELEALKNEVAKTGDTGTAAVNARITKKAEALFAKMEAAKNESDRLGNSAAAAQASEKIINAVGNLDATTVAKKIKDIPKVLDTCNEAIKTLNNSTNENIAEPAKDSINDITKLLNQAASPRSRR